ncbi:MAG: bifunctional 3,4-dihydroxy-2-butanone-4-phosphate synthase/GTP cyclohydrolase II [Gammaproteobacteria bacterium]|nr:MAG: bifunctional 3,4-dihydroxy-2-butanone-4-phosphate synthase/GTP cyclohydrolase II [Gammaproteobacteria bacterium]
MELNSIEDIIQDFRDGKMVVIMDDEDRENEGDLIMAASMVRPQDINFMATHGRGLICLTLTPERCRQLSLPLMVNDSQDQHSTSFTLSIEAAEGVTTGISAHDRACTVEAAVKPDAQPQDLVQPGHVFPLMAQPGGVLTRAGHTEAGCDLARLAGLEPAAVIVEILNQDGSMARRPDLERFATEHNLKVGTIADLIHYRIANEKSVERVAECDLPTECGEFRLYAYQDIVNKGLHLALVMGEIDAGQPTLVRVHVQNALGDLFGAQMKDAGWPLRDTMQRIADNGSGVLVVLGQHESPRDLVQRIQYYNEHEKSGEPVIREEQHELRTHGIGAQILIDLGVRRMRVLSAPKVVHGLSGFGLEVVEYVS